MRKTLERKKKNRAKLREVTPPPEQEYWTHALVCSGRHTRYVKGRHRTRHSCYYLWVPPLDHPEWGRERLVVKTFVR